MAEIDLEEMSKLVPVKPKMNTGLPEIDLDEMSKLVPKIIDSDTGEILPIWADGLSSSTPLNKEILSTEDRFKMSTGDQQGNFNYLKSKYEDVSIDPIDTGFNIKKDGKWYKADVENSWERTKQLLSKGDYKQIANEALKDLVDVSPEIAKIGASVGLAALTGGSSLVAQAAIQGGAMGAASLLESSFGRLKGTYSGDVKDQLMDATMEAGLNILGVTILPVAKIAGVGVKKISEKAAETELVKQIGFGLSKVGNIVNKLNPIAKENLSKTVSLLTNTSDEQASTLISSKGGVGKRMVSASIKAGGKEGGTIEQLMSDGITEAIALSDDVSKGLSGWYGSGLKNVVKKAGSKVAFNQADVSGSIVDFFKDQGVYKQGKFLSQADLKLLTGEQQPLVRLLASNKKAYGYLREIADNVTVWNNQAVSSTGEAVAESIIKFDKEINGLFRSLTKRSSIEGLTDLTPELYKIRDFMKQSIHQNLENSFKQAGVKNEITQALRNLQSNYVIMKKELDPVLSIATKIKQGKGDIKLGRQLYNRLISQNNKKLPVGQMIEKNIPELSKFSPKIAERMTAIKEIDAAMAFTPTIRKNVINFNNPLTLIPAIAGGPLGVLGQVAATSPRYVSKLVESMSKPQQQVALKSVNKLRKYLLTIPKEQLNTLLDNPTLLNNLVNAPLQAVRSYQQSSNSLSQQTLDTLQGPKQ